MMAESRSAPLAEATGWSAREQALLKSAYRVAARQGSHRTTLHAIARAAGVSKGLLIYYFTSKEQLLLATMRWVLLRTAHRIRSSITARVQQPRDAVHALIDAVFIGAQQNRDFYLLYLDLIEYGARDHAFRTLATIVRETAEDAYGAVLHDLAQHGIAAVANQDETAAQMRAYIDGTFLTWLQEPHWKRAYPAYRARCFEGVLQLLIAAHPVRR